MRLIAINGAQSYSESRHLLMIRGNNMADTKLQKGGCLCGNFKYQFSQSDVISAHHCHCTDCQKSTGSGKATIVMIPDESLVAEGSLKFYTVKGTAGSHISRGFCENCGSPVISFVEENSSTKFMNLLA